GSIDELFPHRRIHSSSADGRDHRKTIPRIRYHFERGDCRFVVRVAHHHAHDVRSFPEIGKGNEARENVSRERTRVSMERELLRRWIALGSAPPTLYARPDWRDDLPQCVL